MKLILAGGGDASQSKEVDTFFIGLLPNKRFAFIPHAISPDIWDFDKSFNWLKSHNVFDNCSIEMLKEFYYFKEDDYLIFDALYLMGGNTYKLLHTIRSTGLDYRLTDLLDRMIIYGISAGAIVLGATIDPAATGPEKDENYLNLTDLKGLDYLNGYLVATHYALETLPELVTLSNTLKRKIIAIPETSGVYVENNKCKVIGRDSILILNGAMISEYKMNEQFELI